MKKIIVLLIMFLIIGFVYSYNSIYATTQINNNELFIPDISKRTTPNDLLVMVFLYDDYPNHDKGTDLVFNMTDQEIQTKYYNEIFGSGNIEQQTWSVNDFYKENSNGKFYFNPILIGDNTTGIYPIRFNKTYDADKFSSDIKEGFKTLADKGFVPDNKFNIKYLGETQEKQVICIFPTINVAHYGTYYLNEEIVSNVVVMDYCSVVSTAAHELGHAIEMPDLYGQMGQATLMGETTLQSTIPDLRYPDSYNYTIPAHVDPLHKIALGWNDYEIVDKNSSVRLYPTTSQSYNTVIVPTEDNNQYYIIENRKADSFESQITMYASRGDIDDPEEAGYSNYEGINIWRVDKLGYDELGAYQTCDRKGDFVISVLQNPTDAFFPRKYSNSTDVNDCSKESTNIKITYIKDNPDGSIDIDISFDEKYKNSYYVRYNANDGTDTYVDETYLYGQNIKLPTDLFSENGKEFICWNTEADGSGTNYYTHDNVYGLSEKNDDIVNLYAKYKKEKYTVKFYINGREDLMPEVSDVVGPYVLPECDAKYFSSDFEFKGWLYLGSLYQPGNQINVDNDIELVAKLELKTSFNVNFNVNGGSFVESQTVDRGTTIDEPATPIKEGYTFGGWYEDCTFKVQFYSGRLIYNDLTLYAKWIPNENVVKEINITVQLPKVGEKVTAEKYDESYEEYDWSTQTPQATILIPEDSKYGLADFGENTKYMHWVTGLDDMASLFVGEFEYNTDYYAQIILEPNSECLFDDDVKVKVNGKDVDRIINLASDFIVLAVKLTTEKEPEKVSYEILEGANQIYSIEKRNDLVIRVNGEIEKFVGLKIDNVEVESINYTVTSGSTIVTIKNEYLNTFKTGKHTITFIYQDGEVSTNVDIIKDNDNTLTNITSDDEVVSPHTADNIVLWTLLLLISTIGIVISCKFIKRENFNK